MVFNIPEKLDFRVPWGWISGAFGMNLGWRGDDIRLEALHYRVLRARWRIDFGSKTESLVASVLLTLRRDRDTR